MLSANQGAVNLPGEVVHILHGVVDGSRQDGVAVAQGRVEEGTVAVGRAEVVARNL